jgi:signal transduction histidine kinase
VSDGKLVGVLSLAAWRPGAFGANTAGALAPLTEIAALLLGHAAVDEELRHRLATLQTTASEVLAESLHELKSPLHAAAGFVDIVAEEKSGPLNEQQKDFLNTARAEFGRVKEALATLVEVGAAAAQRPLQLEVVEASAITAEAVQRFTGQAMRSDVQLVEHNDPSAAPVRADRAAIQQVLANFVQNALRVVPPGSVIEVATTCMPEWTCFSVADRGPGLPTGDPAQLFEVFQQGDSRSGVREAGNVGLGLSLSKKIVAQHQGTIWAENRDGGGSRFCFALPSVTRD